MKKYFSMLIAILLISLFGTAYAADSDAYTINGITFSGINGTPMDSPSHSCMINASITKNSQTDNSDTTVIATYATDGTMLGWTVMTSDYDVGKTVTLGTLVSTPYDKEIGIIRVFVWDDIDSMRPFSAVYEKTVNEMEPVADIYDPTEDKYIPDSFTVKATVVSSARTSSDLDNNEFIMEMSTEFPSYDDILTENRYEYLLTRWKRTMEYYFGSSILTMQYQANIKFTSDLDLYDKLFQEADITVIKNKDGSITATAFEPTGNTDAKVLNAADYVKNSDLGSNGYSSANSKIKFGSDYYTLDTKYGKPNVDLYVNGALYSTIRGYTITASDGATSINVADMFDRLIGGAQGNVTLVKDAGEYGYSKIFVNYYEVAEVAAVTHKSGATTIDFSIKNALSYTDSTPNAVTMTAVNKLIINDDSVKNNDVRIKVTKNGTEIAISDIKQDDIIAIKTDLLNLSYRTACDPQFIEILVTDKSVTGMLHELRDSDETVVFNSETYKAVDYLDLANSRFAVGEIYKITLDPFGRIYDYEATALTKKYAILEKVNIDDDTVTLILADGTKKVFDLAGTSTATKNNALQILYGGTYGTASANKVAPQDRVVEYKVKSSTGEISSLYSTSSIGGTALEYNARTGKLGSYMLDETSYIIDASSYNGGVNDYRAISLSHLYDGEKYDAYVFNKVGDFYAFVVITKMGDPVNSSSRFAVARGIASPVADADGETYTAMNVLYDGTDDYTLKLSENLTINGTYAYSYYMVNDLLRAGTAFFFDTDADGFVSEIYTIYDYTSANTYAAMTDAFKGNANLTGKYDSTTPNKWAFTMNPSVTPDIQLTFGVITGKDKSSVDLGVVSNDSYFGNIINKNICDDKTTLQGIYNFSFADDCAVYTYDLGDTTVTKVEDRLSVENSVSNIQASQFRLFENYSDSEIINWGTVNGDTIEDYANYALLMLVDGEVVAVYQIIR